MKKVSLSLFLMLLVASIGLHAQHLLAGATSLATAALKWESTTHNFGEIAQGVPVTTTFSFTNTSNAPLLINQVKGSCGCTVTTYSKEAIAPGAKGFVTATYNAAQAGAFRKTVSVVVNTQPEEIVLSLQGTVVAKAKN